MLEAEPTETLNLDGKGPSPTELAEADRVVRFLEALLPALSDEGEAAQALHDIGQLKLHPLDNPEGALEALKAAFTRRPSLHVARAYHKAAMRAGSVDDQLLALEGAVRAAASPAARAALETERGTLLERTVGNLPAARQAYATAVELNPASLSAPLALLRLALKDGDHETAAALCRRVADTTSDARVKAEYLAWAGRLHESAGHREAAAAAVVSAEVHAPDSPSVRFLMERLHASGGKLRELVALLEAEIADGTLGAVEGWFDVGVLARYHLGDLDLAEKAFAKVAADASDATQKAALGELREIAAHKGEWQRVLDAQLQGLPSEGEGLGRAIAWTRVGQLREEKLDDLDGAAEAYAQGVEAEPTYLPALEGAGRVFGKKGTVDRLLWMHRLEADHAPSPGERAVALRRAGELLVADPARADEGITLLREALAAAPDHAGIFNALERALRRRGAFAELCDLYQHELERTAPSERPRRRAWLLLQIGELAADRLSDRRRAIAALRSAAEIPADAPHQALTRLGQLYEDEGDLAELEKVLLLLSGLTDDPVLLASLCERIAQLQEQRGDVDAAVATYRRALADAPSSHSIHAMAGRAFGRAERWPDLLALHQRSFESGSPAERAAYGYKAGVLLARRMGRLADGIARLEEVRKEAPAHAPTLAALASLYEDAQRWPELSSVLGGLPPTPARRVQRAALAEACGRLEEAATLWQEAVDAGVSAAARPRARLLAQLGRWKDLQASILAANPNGSASRAAAHARYRAAELHLERTGEPARAAELLTASVATDAESLTPRLALVRALDDDSPALRAALTELVARVRDPALREALLGQLANHRLMSEGEALATRVNQMSLAPRDPVLMVRIEQAMESRHNREALVALLRDLVRDPKADAALAAASGERLGALLEELGSLREAADAFEAALASEQPCFLARLALPRVYAALGDEPRLLQALRDLANALPPRAERAAVLRRLAAHHARHDDAYSAAATLEEALQAHPLDYVALRELAAMVEGSQPERMLDPLLRAFAAEPAGPQRRNVGLTLAARLVRASRLGPAREVLDRLLSDDANELRVWLLRAELETAAAAWAPAAQALATVAAHADAEPDVKIEALRRKVTLELDQLNDLEAARATADKLGELAPDDLPAMEVRLQVAEQAEDHPRAAELLARLVSQPLLDDERRAALQLQLASLQEVKLDDVAAAIRTLGGIKLPARRRDAVDRLLDLGGRTGRWDLAASALEATLDRGDAPNKDRSSSPDNGAEMEPQWELAIRSRLANLLEGPLARAESAVKQYERIVAIDPSHGPALERLAELSAASAPDKAIDYHSALLTANPMRLSSYRALRQLFIRVGEEDGAFLTEALLEGAGLADEEEGYFYTQRRARLHGTSDGVLSEEERALLAPEATSAPFALLHALTPHLATVFPVDYAGYGVAGPESAAGAPTQAAAQRAAQLFDVSAFRLLAAPNRVGACVEPGAPPVLLVPRNLDDATPREQGRVLGELMARVAFDSIVGDPRRLSPISPALLEHVLWAACELAAPDAVAPQRGRPVYEDIKRRLAAALVSQPRTELAMAAGRVLDESGWSGAGILESMERIGMRAALFAAQDPAVAIVAARAAGGRGLESLPASLAAALPFVVSRSHLALRRRLKMGVSS